MLLEYTNNGIKKQITTDINLQEGQMSTISKILNLLPEDFIDNEECRIVETFPKVSEYTSEVDLVSGLQDKLSKIGNMITSKVKIIDHSEWIFKIELTGKLIDNIFVLVYLVPHIKAPLSRFLRKDLSLINYVVNNGRIRDGQNFSLIFRFISNKNSNVSLSNIEDLISRYRDNKDLSEYIINIFKEIYEVSPFKLNTSEVITSDKLDITSVNEETINRLRTGV